MPQSKRWWVLSRANGTKRRTGRLPGARVLIPPDYLHPGKRKALSEVWSSGRMAAMADQPRVVISDLKNMADYQE